MRKFKCTLDLSRRLWQTKTLWKKQKQCFIMTLQIERKIKDTSAFPSTVKLSCKIPDCYY